MENNSDVKKKEIMIVVLGMLLIITIILSIGSYYNYYMNSVDNIPHYVNSDYSYDEDDEYYDVLDDLLPSENEEDNKKDGNDADGDLDSDEYDVLIDSGIYAEKLPSDMNFEIKKFYKVMHENDYEFYQNGKVIEKDLDKNFKYSLVLDNTQFILKKVSEVIETTDPGDNGCLKNTKDEYLKSKNKSNINIYSEYASVYDFDEFKSNYNKIFGVSNPEFISFDFNFEPCGVDTKNNTFNCFDGCGGGFLSGYEALYSKYIKSEKNTDSVIIYERETYCTWSGLAKDKVFCKDNSGFEKAKEIIKDDNYPKDFDTWGQIYKHTFKINDDGLYYWYSTEPVDKV